MGIYFKWFIFGLEMNKFEFKFEKYFEILIAYFPNFSFKINFK